MKALRGRLLPEPCVLTVGKFESIHRGHRVLLETTVTMAKAAGLASAVIAFTPHPYCVTGNKKYKPLFTPEERLYLLAQTGVDYLLEYPFDAAFMQTSRADFGSILFNNLQARRVVVGEGFRYGRRRAGTAESLRHTAREHSAEVYVINDYKNISTSLIRGLLEAPGEVLRLGEAAEALGFPFFVTGSVTEGRKLGRKLGFPTLNLTPPGDKYLPRYGVYATQTHLEGRCFNGVTNIGVRPTVNAGKTAPTVETHLFGYSGDAYKAKIRVELLHFIREEKKYESKDELIRQIASDVKTAERLTAIK